MLHWVMIDTSESLSDEDNVVGELLSTRDRAIG